MTKERKIFILKLSVTILLLGLMAFFVARDWSRISSMFLSMRLPYFLLAAGALVLSNFTGYAVWQNAFLSMRVTTPPLMVARSYMLGAFYNNVLPSSIGGDVVKVIEMKDHGITVQQSVAAILIDRVTSFYVLILSFFVSFSFFFIARLGTLTIIGINILFLAVSIGIGALVYNERTFAIIVATVRRVIPWKKAAEFIVSIFAAFHQLKNKRRFALIMVVCVCITQALRILVNYFVGIALGLAIPVYFYFLFIPVVGTAMILPISINGYGIAEVIGAWLFNSFVHGVGYSEAGMLMFTAHIALLIGNFICGGAFFIPKRRSAETSSHADTDTAAAEQQPRRP